MMDKETQNMIKQLKRDKNYHAIFVNFGRIAYLNNIPRSYRKKEIKKLKSEGRYEDIFSKYGEEEYNKILLHACIQEMKEAKGSLRAYSWGILQRIKMFTKKVGIYTASILLECSAILIEAGQEKIDENGIKYEKEIENYNENISQYAEEVKKMHLSDLQIIMKVMDDMWNNIQGYGTPQKDIYGYLELDLATKDGYGVCRNMASDMAKKLNQINPKYNARTMFVTMGEEGNYYLADIETKMVEFNENIEEDGRGVHQTLNENIRQEKEKSIPELIGETMTEGAKNVIGNHMITLIDIPEEGVILVADPTNPSIGLYKNGKIKMFNSGKEYVTNEGSNMLFNGYEGLETVGDFIDSFTNESSYEKLKEEYGLEQQNEALEYVRNFKNKEKEYKQSLKVDYVPKVKEKQPQSENIEKQQTIDEDMQL